MLLALLEMLCWWQVLDLRNGRGKIHLHLAFAGQCFALMSLFSLLEVGESFAIWQDSAGDSEISAVAMRDILTPLVYNSSAGKVTTLIPLPWR